MTRNVERSVEYFHDQHFPLAAFRPAMTREFKPYKPSPAAALEICKQWGISPTEAIMIGDSAKDDVSEAMKVSFRFPASMLPCLVMEFCGILQNKRMYCIFLKIFLALHVRVTLKETWTTFRFLLSAV